MRPDIILRAVQSATHFAKEHEAEFLKTVQTAWEERYAQSQAAEKQELATAPHRLAELDNLIRGLFEGSVTGIMLERQIQRLAKTYDQEQTALKKRIAELEASLSEIPDVKKNEARFLALVRKYEDITKVTNERLYAFIEKILVHAPTGGRSAQRRQQPPSTKATGCNTASMAKTIGSAGGRGKELRHLRAAIRTIWEDASPVLKAG